MNIKLPWSKALLIILSIFILINLSVLNYLVFYKPTSADKPVTPSLATTTQKPTNGFSTQIVVDEKGEELQIVDYDLIKEQIKTATSSLTQQVNDLSQSVSTISTTPQTQTIETITQTSSVKEYYIPLGTGSTNSRTWIDLPGVEAYLAPSNYGTITELYFEATLRNPAGVGTAYARVNNVTDSTSLFETEVYYTGSSAQMISSGKMPVPTQTKLYRVQLKSSIGAEVFLDSARLKVFVK